jgi:hypothetical protein
MSNYKDLKVQQQKRNAVLKNWRRKEGQTYDQPQ